MSRPPQPQPAEAKPDTFQAAQELQQKKERREAEEEAAAADGGVRVPIRHTRPRLEDLVCVRGLGTGGFAKVYMVRDRGSFIEYALKVIPKARLLRGRPIQARHEKAALQLLHDRHVTVTLTVPPHRPTTVT